MFMGLMTILIQQMQWREALEEAQDPESLEKIRADVMLSKQTMLQKCEHFLDELQDYPQAVAQVRGLMFLQKFLQDIDARLEVIE